MSWLDRHLYFVLLLVRGMELCRYVIVCTGTYFMSVLNSEAYTNEDIGNLQLLNVFRYPIIKLKV